jgi:AcrR family transcriptional regulator
MSETPQADGRTRRAEVVRAQRRAQILDTALRVFSENGYDRTSISDIVAEAGVARGTFYQYFDSKHAIFSELLERLLNELRNSVGGVDPVPGSDTFEDQLIAIVTGILQTTIDNRPLTRIIFRVAVGVDEELDQRLREFYTNLETFLERSLQLGIAGGFVRADVDATVTATCILGSIRQVVVRYVVESDEAFDTEAVATAALAYNLRGLI